MPIINRLSNGTETREYVGRVVKVEKYVGNRNWSDTLDYSDYRSTDVTEALVYMGRTMKEWDRERGGYVHEVERPIGKRFETIECTNLFCDRGAAFLTPIVDEVFHPELVEDWIAYDELQRAIFAQAVADNAVRLAAEKARKEQEEKDRPVPGKKMKVVKGRKVPIGFVGTVAFVTGSGNVLLKDDDKWRDRNADGRWVAASNLRAV